MSLTRSWWMLADGSVGPACDPAEANRITLENWLNARPRKHLTKNGVRLVPSGKAPRPPKFWYVYKIAGPPVTYTLKGPR